MDVSVVHVFAAADTAAQLEAVTRLLVAAGLGAALGLERSMSGKHAGMRTYALVSMGSALFVVIESIVSFQLSQFSGINPLALASSIIIGIGFIGAGLSHSNTGEAHLELTTASGIWVSAGIGMACGFGLYTVAVATAVIGLLVFSMFLRLENVLRKHYGMSRE